MLRSKAFLLAFNLFLFFLFYINYNILVFKMKSIIFNYISISLTLQTYQHFRCFLLMVHLIDNIATNIVNLSENYFIEKHELCMTA